MCGLQEKRNLESPELLKIIILKADIGIELQSKVVYKFVCNLLVEMVL